MFGKWLNVIPLLISVGLTDPRLEDVGLALGHMGVSLHELEEYIKHVDPIEFAKEVVAFPVPRQNDLKFPNPESKEVQQRKVFEFVPEHLPYMHPELNGRLFSADGLLLVRGGVILTYTFSI